MVYCVDSSYILDGQVCAMKSSARIATVVVISLLLLTALVVVVDTNLLGTKSNPSSSTNVGTNISSGLTTTGTSSGTTTPALITKAQSGLVASDRLSSPQTQLQLQSNQTYWAYGGTAAVDSSYYSVDVATNGLQIGVVSPTQGQWVGYYAVSPPTDATLVSALLTAPSSPVPGDYSVGLYVQATNEMLNYVACIAAATPLGTTWEVVHDHATNSSTGVITPLWGISSAAQKLTQDCTIITNGTNDLQVYLNHVVVYQSTTLQLGMQAPFSYYLESESSTAGSLIYGGYQNFYATQGGNVTITNAPTDALSAAIVDSNGTVLATAPVVSGTASFAMGRYSFPQVANVKLYSSQADSNSTLVASTQHPISIYGGDVFTSGPNPTPSSTSMLSVSAVNGAGENINGISLTIRQNRDTVESGYMPAIFSLNNAQSYTVTASDYGNYTFDHWSDGSTLRTMTLSVTSDTQLTAVYRLSNASAPSGMSVLSVTAVDSDNSSLTGFSVSVWQGGTLVATSYSPSSFLLNDGVQYQVVVSSYGGYQFEEWGSGSTSAVYLVSGSSPTPVINLEAIFSGSG